MADGLCVLSPDEHAMVLFTNASFSDYLRIPPQAVLGRCVFVRLSVSRGMHFSLDHLVTDETNEPTHDVHHHHQHHNTK